MNPHLTIVVRLNGGMGNQLFQYAAGYACARQWQGRLLLDRHCLRRADRRFALGDLNISAGLLAWGSRKMIMATLASSPRPALALCRSWLKHQGKIVLLAETEQARPDILNWPAGIRTVVLCGYWQNPAIFAGCGEDLRREFSPRRPWPIEVAELQKETAGNESVSLHVRRGDYLAAGRRNLLSAEYYQQAIRRVLDHYPAARFYVFSDDSAWVRVHLLLPPGSRFLSSVYGRTPLPDLWLMASCRHHILSNSTFSWWGAWLGRRGGLILAPEGMPAADPDLPWQVLTIKGEL